MSADLLIDTATVLGGIEIPSVGLALLRPGIISVEGDGEEEIETTDADEDDEPGGDAEAAEEGDGDEDDDPGSADEADAAEEHED